jgi:raffinose/stachyose/melibiose transport system substrate-binding protein
MINRLRAPRAFITIAVVGAASLALTSCAAGGAEEPSADGKTVITFGSWIPSADQWKVLEPLFEEENPDIDVQFTPMADYTPFIEELDNQILAGEVPDVYAIQPGASFEDYSEYAMPISEYAEGWVDELQTAPQDATTTADGEVKAVPILLAGQEFYLYNDTLFEELGLSLPQNYDELVAVSAAARAAGYSPFAMGAADAWHDNDFFVWLSNQYGNGGDVYKAAAGELDWDSENLVAAATRWQQLFDDGVFQDAASTTTTYPSARDDFFLAQKSIAFPTGSWHVGLSFMDNSERVGAAAETDEIGMAVFPTIGEKDAGVTNGVDYALAISDDIDPAKLDAAAKFIEFMAIGSGQQYWVDGLQGFSAAKNIEPNIEGQSELAVESVKAVSDALAASEWPRKVISADNPSLETDLGVVLQNIAGGADPASELATLNR